MNELEIINRVKTFTAFTVESIGEECSSPDSGSSTLNLKGKDADGIERETWVTVPCPELQEPIAARLNRKVRGEPAIEPVKSLHLPPVRLKPEPEDGESPESWIANVEEYIGRTAHQLLGQAFNSYEDTELRELIRQSLSAWIEANPAANYYAEASAPLSPKAFGLVERIAMLLGITDSTVMSERAAREIDLSREKDLCGLFLFGKSYLGKTTAAYRFAELYLAARILGRIENGEDVRHFGEELPVIWEADAFGDTAKAKAKATTLAGWLDSLTEPEVLILDDLDKYQFSESVGTALFGMVKRRVEARKFTIFTANQNVLQISKRLLPDTREPFVNRMKAHFLPVKFDGV